MRKWFGVNASRSSTSELTSVNERLLTRDSTSVIAVNNTSSVRTWFCRTTSRAFWQDLTKRSHTPPHVGCCWRVEYPLNSFFTQRACDFVLIPPIKVLLRSKFNVKFVTKTLSFQLIRSGCTCFGHWSELWRPLSENIELENVGFSRPPLQIYVPVTKLLFSDCDVIFWTRQENKPEPWENSERFSKLRSSSPDSGIVKEEIIDYDDSVEPAPTEYEKVKY